MPRRFILEWLAGGRGPETREEFHEWFVHWLVYSDEEVALDLLKWVRENRAKGALAEFLTPFGRIGRPKGRTVDLKLQGTIAFIAYQACNLSRKEILFHLGKLDSPNDVPTPSQYRDLKERMARGKEAIFKANPDDQKVLFPLVKSIDAMSPAQRKTWAIESLRKQKAI